MAFGRLAAGDAQRARERGLRHVAGGLYGAARSPRGLVQAFAESLQGRRGGRKGRCLSCIGG
ncbi:hypothetical protein AMK15_24850 [Streptomyces sp. MJM1172]|nr:hypothetical protein AMK15_24850 [Streptomyces sp. MJM1172]